MDNDWHTITNFALDRIMAIETIDDIPFVPNETVDFEHYFDDVIGETIPPRDVEKIKILFRFTEKQFPYVVSKPLHPSQVIVDREGHVLSIEVRPNYELDHHILALGRDVEVLSPLSYRQHIYEILVESLKKYDSVQIEHTDEP